MSPRHAATLLAACVVLAAAAPASARGRRHDATALAVRADAAHAAGRSTEAAELYVRAYRAMTSEEKVALGEVIVGAALADLRTSFESTADTSFATRAGALLDEYERDTGSAAPAALAEHRAWIEIAVAVPEPEPEPAFVDDDPAPLPTRHAFEAEPRPDDDPPASRERDVGGPVAIGLGLAASVGGAVMVGLGAPLGPEAHRVRDAALTDPEFIALPAADADAYTEDMNAYVHSMERRGQTLVVAGSVLLAAGVSVAIYGVVRLVRHRRGTHRESARIRPIVGGAAF